MLKRRNKGFTLIELMVVLAIMGILMSLSLVSYQGARKSARDGKRKADLEQVRSALEMCYADNGSYPGTIYDVSGNISCGAKTYLSGTPKDPLTNDSYYYSSPGGTYTLCARLELGSITSPSGCDGANDCGTGRTCSYKVTNP